MWRVTLFGVAVLGALAACDDHLFPARRVPVDGEGWCGVRELFAAQCTSCHGALALGELDLETDPASALVGVPSSGWPEVLLVDPGSPDTSLLVHKVRATQGDRGSEMPPASGGVGEELAELVRAWVADGAPTVCDETPDDGVHPPGYGTPDQHGQDAKLQVLACPSCHGERLEGGEGGALSCASECHGGGPQWASNCAWCHGSDESGLPPEDIDDSAPTDISFPGHGAHVSGRIATPMGCVACHQEPTDAFSAGHLFVGDSTPGVAEVTLLDAPLPGGTYDGESCTVACHGDGRGTGSIARLDGSRACDGCHDAGPGADALSEPHDKHVEEGLSCSECHGGTVSGWETVVGVSLHVNGTPDVGMPPEMVRVGGLCTGTCHGEAHASRPWADD